EEVVHDLRRALMGDDGGVDAGDRLEQFGGEIAAGAHRRRSDIERPSRSLRDGDDVADRLGRERGMREQRNGHRRDQPDRREVLARIEAGIGVEARIDGDRSSMAEEQRIAVGRALDEGASADEAGAAGAVVHHDLLPERACKLLRDDARHGVDAAAGRIGHDESDGASGIILGEGMAANNHRDRSNGRGPPQTAHRSLPYFLAEPTAALDARGAAAESQLSYSLSSLSGRRGCPPAGARFRPSPATCDASTPRSEDRRPTGVSGLRQFPLPRPDAVARAPQGALVWTCWGVLLSQIVT